MAKKNEMLNSPLVEQYKVTFYNNNFYIKMKLCNMYNIRFIFFF